ncbi:MAG: GHMP kinase [Sterolibacteriaceae bacterium]|nr:GHMP kinase [Sterolibacteriaceae bacterium]MBK9084323.1 GHMP kinase [Sterolibacteriaceae bacterium]
MPTRVLSNADVSVAVEAPARLHMGFFDLNGSLGRKYGSLGLTLDGLSTHVSVSRGLGASLSGAESERARRYLNRLREVIDLPEDISVSVHTAIPSHAGLGSGTQLALALGTAASRLAGSDLSPREIAHLLDRGARSGIGVAAFEQGGFVIDGGRGANDAPPPLIARLAFPPAWRILLLLDQAAAGLHGQAEASAFAELPPFPEVESQRLCRELLIRGLPALAEADLAAFGKVITDLQNTIGDYFAPAQGGRYTSPRVAAALAALSAGGAECIGQSSWGPTGFAILASDSDARLWKERLAPEFSSLDLMICSARNRGGETTAVTESGSPRVERSMLGRSGRND